MHYAIPILLLLPSVQSDKVPRSQAVFESDIDLAEAVRELAFDPDKLFLDKRDLGPWITIAYTGDDYGWPVYSISVFHGCHSEEPRTDQCYDALRARMVRAPAPPDLNRPRDRGRTLIWELFDELKSQDEDLPTALSKRGLEWKEADLRQCPGAISVLAKSEEMHWVPSYISRPTTVDDYPIVAHADMVEIKFLHYARVSTYRGYLAEGTPATWADEFTDALEKCWQDATSPPPWQR